RRVGMVRMLMAAAVAAALLLPGAAAAAPAAAPAAAQTDWFGVSTERVVMIAAGAAIGALVIHVAAPSEIGAIAGGLLGGMAAEWWYRNGGEERVHAWLRTPAASAPAPALTPRPLRQAALR